MIEVEKGNAAHCIVNCRDSGIAMEVKTHFSFHVENHLYHPLVKARKWDGRVSLYNPQDRRLHNGLIPHLEQFAKERGYPIKVNFDDRNDITLDWVQKLTDGLNIGDGKGNHIKLHDYQVSGVYDGLREKRILLRSATSSGKSAMLYVMTRFLEDDVEGKILLIVPNVSLINQMSSDFKEYSELNHWNVDARIHKISAGESKTSKKKIFLSTWQSLSKQDAEYFAQFSAILVDEAHGSRATVLTKILNNCVNAWYRIGVTGTVDERGERLKTNKLVLQGLFGYIKNVISAKELMDRGVVAELDIKILRLKYSDEVKKEFRRNKPEYHEEVKWICVNEKRNKFIANLAIKQEKNVLILTQYVENQGKILYDLIKSKAENKEVFFVSGEMDGSERERIRKLCETRDDIILIGTYQTMSTGVSIKNLHSFIAASPSKSMVRVLQSIGRLLRKNATKTSAVMFDIADDMSVQSYTNYAKLHLMERMKIYAEEKFRSKIIDLDF
jgi:superfamily II DNA or RNA helicase